MLKVFDDRYPYKGFHGCDSLCHLRIYQGEQETVVIATELAENSGTSVTNMCETLATEVCRRFAIPYDKLTWVEHYPDRGFIAGRPQYKEEFDWVTFTQTPSWLRHPVWQPATKEEVEGRVGCALEPIPDRGQPE